MEHENRWEHLDKHLMVCLAGARRTELHRLQVRDACESIFNSVHRIVLLELLCQSPGHMHGVEWEKGKRTWMSSWSDRQSPMVTLSGWFGARTAERNFPSNMRFSGDSLDSAYSWTFIRQQCQAPCGEMKYLAHHEASFSHVSLAWPRHPEFFCFGRSSR
jgi:hypothetical protein